VRQLDQGADDAASAAVVLDVAYERPVDLQDLDRK
jgi:hypothetical protein